jgi:glycosyltransferase involved in cell wall biosynthesis
MSSVGTAYSKKIFLISTVKNEEDVIEFFVRYHSNIMDGIVIMDNGSTDTTPFILNKLVEEGLPLYLFHDSSVEHAQSQRMTKLMHDTLNNFNPDFIFPLDADEFLYASNGENPKGVIENLDPEKAYYLKSMTFVPDEKDDENEIIIPKRIGHCFREEWLSCYKIAVSKQLINKHALSLYTGNHDVSQGNKKFGPIIKETLTELKLAHYPIRSKEQLMSKILVGWINNLCRYDRTPGEAGHWNKLYQKIKNDRNFLNNNFKEIAHEFLFGRQMDVNEIPLNPLNLSIAENIELKYTNINSVNYTKNLLANCESLALQYAELKKQLLQIQGKR